MVRVNEMLQHIGLRASGQAHELRELPMFGARMSILDVPRRRSRRVAQLLAGFEVTPEFRAGDEQLDAQVQLMRQPPGGDVSIVSERSHAPGWCNRVARRFFAKSGGFLEMLRANIAEVAMFSSRERRNYFTVTFGRA
jgi:hypothetical protein